MQNMKKLLTFLVSAAICPAQVVIKTETDRVRVEIDGKPFTDFVLTGGEAMKPYLHPLRSASGKVVTRYFQMEKVAGEPVDHPHQSRDGSRVFSVFGTSDFIHHDFPADGRLIACFVIPEIEAIHTVVRKPQASLVLMIHGFPSHFFHWKVPRYYFAGG